MTGRSPSNSVKLTMVALSTLLSLLAGWWAWRTFKPKGATFVEDIETRPGAEQEGVRQEGTCVADPLVGLRPRSNIIARGKMGALLQPDGPVARFQNNLGLIRLTDLHEPFSAPRVLLHGDSHMMGICHTKDNCATLLELDLRQEHDLPGALVLNAGCDHYNVYQHVLRTRQLKATLRPQFLLVVVYMGNDFLDLEDVGRPHLDDAGREQPARERPPETTTARMEWLGLSGSLQQGGLFFQGMNQAGYFFRHPERVPVIKKKCEVALGLMQAEAKALDAGMLYVLLPPIDLVMPDRLRPYINDAVKQVLQSGVQQDFYDWFRATLAAAGLETIDLLPDFRKDGRIELYANDMHLWVPGHRLLADIVGPRLAARLAKWKGAPPK